MIDIPAIAAVTQTSAVGSTPLAVTPVVATTANLPEQLKSLMQNIELTGTMPQAPTAQSLTLNTLYGQLTILLPQLVEAKSEQILQQLIAMFQAQKPLTLMMQAGSSPTQVVLLLPSMPNTTASNAQLNSLNGRTILVPSNQLVTPPIGVSLPQGAALNANTASLPRTTLSAIVLPPMPNEPMALNPVAETPLASTPVSTPALPITTPGNVAEGNVSGTSATGILPRLINLITPQAANSVPVGITPRPLADAALPPLALASGSVEQTTTSGNAASPLLQPGSQVNVQFLSVGDTPSATQITSTMPDVTLLRAVVSGHGPNGETLLQTENAVLFVRGAPPLPTGTAVQVAVTQASETTPALITPMSRDTTAETLQQVLVALNNASPDLAQNMVQNIIPRPDANFAPALLLFLAAFKQGGLSSWLGHETTDSLTHAGKVALLNRAIAEMREAGQPAHEMVTGTWHTTPIPVLTDGRLQTVNLFVHNNAQDSKDQGGSVSAVVQSGYTRFLIDLNMTRLGAIQIDGLTNKRKLDMMIRSERPLPLPLRDDLRQTYSNAMGAIDYSGVLTFQEGRKNWLYLQQMDIAPLIT